MPSLSELEARYNAIHGKEVHYLADLRKEPEAWQPEHTERRA